MVTPEIFTIGVISDTHIPDRVSDFHPKLLPSLVEHNVQMIFHAGDISAPRVLEKLQQIAPVTAVRGNRDWLFRNSLLLTEKIEIRGVKVALLHGHVNFRNYLNDKIYHITRGYSFQRYLPRLLTAWSEAKIIVFGHTHQPIIRKIDNRLLFNPGSCTTKSLNSPNPHFGILNIDPGGNVSTRLIELTGYIIEFGKWKQENRHE